MRKKYGFIMIILLFTVFVSPALRQDVYRRYPWPMSLRQSREPRGVYPEADIDMKGYDGLPPASADGLTERPNKYQFIDTALGTDSA
jgi:hypothetical protein